MKAKFKMGADTWTLSTCAPSSSVLIDRTGVRTVAVTDPQAKMVWLSSALSGDFKRRVLLHELGHCAMISFGLIDDIHNLTDPDEWIPVEEWCCNFLADYGKYILKAFGNLIGDQIWDYLPDIYANLLERGA